MNSKQVATVKITDTRTDSPTFPFSVPYSLGVNRLGPLGLGSWGINVNHFYDAASQKLIFGDNRVRTVGYNTYPDGRIWTTSENGEEVYEFSSAGRHLKTRHGLTGSTLYSFAYDAAGRLATLTDKYGQVSTIERDTSGAPLRIRAPGSQITTLTLNGLGLLSQVTNANNEAYRLTYKDAKGLLASFQPPSGTTSTLTYDLLGYLLKDANAGGGFKHFTQSADANDSREILMTTAEGLSTSYVSQDMTATGGEQNRTQIKPNGARSTTSFYPLNQWGSGYETITDEFDNRMFQFIADQRFGNLASFRFYSSHLGLQITSTQIVEGLNSGNPFSYGKIIENHTLNSKTTASEFTLSTKMHLTKSPMGKTMRTAINAAGDVVKTQYASFLPMTFTYDVAGRVTKVQQGTRTTTFTYNTKGLLTAVTKPNGEVTKFAHDLADRMITTTLPDLKTITYTYDPVTTQLTKISTPSGREHKFTYNLFDLIESYLAPLVGTTTNQILYSRNKDGNVTSITYPDGKNVRVTYGRSMAQGLVERIDLPNRQMTFAYNGTETRPSRVQTSEGIITDHTYNHYWPGTITHYLSGNASYYLNMDYDEAKLSQLTLSNLLQFSQTTQVVYGYDNDDFLTRAGDITISRDNVNGVERATTLGRVTSSQMFDAGYGELSRRSFQFNFSTSLYDLQITRDSIGRVTREIESMSGSAAQTLDYVYDNRGRLTTVKTNGTVTSSYAYDANGNRTSAKRGAQTLTYTYDAQDRLMAASNGTKYSYSLNGALSKITDSAGKSSVLAYDLLGNLQSFLRPDGVKIEYTIDGEGRRVIRKRNGVVTTYFIFQSPLQLAAIADASGSIVANFIYGTSDHVPDYMIKGGVRYRFITDTRGTVKLVVNSATGVIAQKIIYDEWGRVVSDSKPGFQPFGFAGGLYDGDTKLVRFGARDYDAETGRWVSKDPILFEGGSANLYGYVANDPVNWIDPIGLWSIGVGVYVGPGGGFVFGQNPDGGWFSSFQGGYGIGGGVFWDPNGTSPGFSKNSCSPTIEMGAFGDAGINVGPLGVGVGVGAGVNVSPGNSSSVYTGGGVYGGLTPSWRVGGGAAVGGQITFR